MKKTKSKKKTEDNNFIVDTKKSIDNNITELYTLIDQEDFIDDNNNPRINHENDNRIMAKKIQNQNRIKYMIKLDNGGKFYNPMSPVSSIRPTKILQTISVSKDKFKEVSQNTFNMYLNFLRSKNISWINNAEREGF